MDLNDLLVSYNQVKVPDRVITNILFPELDYYFPEVELKIELRIEELQEESLPNYYISSTTSSATPRTTWKSPYRDKNKWAEELANSYRKAGVTNENAIKMLVALDALESGWGRSAQGKFNFGNITTGRSWKGSYVEGKDHNADGEPIKQKFRSYNSMDEYAKDKVQFLKRLYDFDENDNATTFIAKLTGLNKGGRKYAESRSYATSLTKVYNSFRIGGVIKKYLNSGVIVLDNTKVVIPVKPLNIPVLPQLSYFIPDNRGDYERELSLKLAERIYNQYIEDKKTEKGLQDLNAFLTFTDYATLGLGAGNLVTKGAKLIGKRSIRLILADKLNKTNIPINSESTYSKLDPLKVHYKRLINGGWNKLENLGDVMSSGKITVLNIAELDRRNKAYLIIKSKFPKVSDSEIEKFINENAKEGMSINNGTTPSGIILMNGNNSLIKNNYTRAVSHELDHSIHYPSLPALGFDLDYLRKVLGDYFIDHNNTELAARGSLIKDYFGITDPNQPITEDMLKLVAKNYIKDTGFNNNMTEFFSSIKDWKLAAEWLSKYSSIIATPIVVNNKD